METMKLTSFTITITTTTKHDQCVLNCGTEFLQLQQKDLQDNCSSILGFRTQVRNCNFRNQVKIKLRDHFIDGIINDQLQQRLLSLSASTVQRVCEKHQNVRV